MSSVSLRDFAQEIYELGPKGTLFRAGWEIRDRTRLLRPTGGESPMALQRSPSTRPWTSHLPFADPIAVAEAMRPRIPSGRLLELAAAARAAVNGRILCFGRWTGDYGFPIDWHVNPVTGERWNPADLWTPSSADERRVGDIKLTWEIARFPHAYHVARAAAFDRPNAPRYAEAMLAQMRAFEQENPYGIGVHWGSGQEVAFRLLAWLFALDVLCLRSTVAASASEVVRHALLAGGRFIAARLDYARVAVYNNHLLSEALALFGVGALLPEGAETRRWRDFGRRILDEESERQFYRDGGYIQQSHNYHRVALYDLLWACAFARSMGDAPSPSWLSAMERSLDFLVAHQNPDDGWLPNYGANDGARPSILSTCDFPDFRPVLQTVSLAVRGERIYEPGPWDEMAAWFMGPKALDEPLRRLDRVSVSFPVVGYHVLRGVDPSSFAAFRCGSLLDRFSQIDMLHLDVWWRGQNVLVDGGSYQYNGPEKWHNHFMRTGSHNTVSVDGHDQMVHFRRFKVLYWTRATLLQFEDHAAWTLAVGEHYGFRRHRGQCVHRRAVVFLKDDIWVVFDTVSGRGRHASRLHWLAGAFPFAGDEATGTVTLETPGGPFTVSVFDASGAPRPTTVACGQEEPPRGWVSRHYAERTAAPSIVAEQNGPAPQTFVTVLAGRPFELRNSGTTWLLTPQDSPTFEIRHDAHSTVSVTTR